MVETNRLTGDPIMDLSLLEDFILVAAQGGFGPAARAHDRSKATLARRVGELEASLGVRLFERGPRRLRLTDDGAALYARLEGPLNEIMEATEAAATGAANPLGRLRVSTPILFGHLYMPQIACGFARLYPEVHLEVTASDRPVDLVEDGFDIAIRINPPPDALLTGRRLMVDQLLAVSVAAPPGKAIRKDQGCSVPAVVLVRSPEQDRWEIATEDRRITILPEPVLRFSSIFMVRDAVLAGMGTALLPNSLVRQDLETGRLTSWGVLVDYQIDVWVLHASRRLVSPKVSAFVNFMIGHFDSSKRPSGLPGDRTV